MNVNNYMNCKREREREKEGKIGQIRKIREYVRIRDSLIPRKQKI